jgi:hypothetical protein
MICNCTYCDKEVDRKYKRKVTFCDYRCARKYYKALDGKTVDPLTCERPGCGHSFMPVDERQKYCSGKCRKKHSNDLASENIKKKCIEEKLELKRTCQYVFCRKALLANKNKQAKYCTSRCKVDQRNHELRIIERRRRREANKVKLCQNPKCNGPMPKNKYRKAIYCSLECKTVAYWLIKKEKNKTNKEKIAIDEAIKKMRIRKAQLDKEIDEKNMWEDQNKKNKAKAHSSLSI